MVARPVTGVCRMCAAVARLCYRVVACAVGGAWLAAEAFVEQRVGAGEEAALCGYMAPGEGSEIDKPAEFANCGWKHLLFRRGGVLLHSATGALAADHPAQRAGRSSEAEEVERVCATYSRPRVHAAAHRTG